jgi:hypothetical protein
MDRTCSTHAGNEKLVNVLVENPSITKYLSDLPTSLLELGKPVRMLENNSKIDLGEIGCVWTELNSLMTRSDGGLL